MGTGANPVYGVRLYFSTRNTACLRKATMQDPIISTVDTDLALLSPDPLGFVLSEARALVEEATLVLTPGKVVLVQISVVDSSALEELIG